MTSPTDELPVNMLSPELVAKIQKIFIRSRYLANDVFSGEYETAFRGRGMEFEEVREYIPGDDIRTIDWNVSARMDRPFVKVFREEREQTLVLIIDASASVLFGSRVRLKKDLMAEVAALLAYAAINSNDKVGLIVFSDHVEKFIPPKKGRGHVWKVISEILALTPSARKTDIAGALRFFSKVIHRRSICFLISDFLAEDFEAELQIARIQHDVIPMIMGDPLEGSLPEAGLICLEDLETGAKTIIDMGSPRVREAFIKQREEATRKREALFRRLAVDHLKLQTDEDTINPLLKFFRMREKKL